MSWAAGRRTRRVEGQAELLATLRGGPQTRAGSPPSRLPDSSRPTRLRGNSRNPLGLPPQHPTPAHYTLASCRSWSRTFSWCRVLSPKAEPWYPGVMGLAFGAGAGARPVENKNGPALGAGTPAGTTGAWGLPAGATEGCRRGPSVGLQTPGPGLELKKSRSDCSLWGMKAGVKWPCRRRRLQALHPACPPRCSRGLG